MTRLVTALGTCLVLGSAGAVCAQETAAPPPHMSVVDGQVFLDRESGREPAEGNTPLVVGDRIRAERGRAEVLLGDGSALHLDERTTIDINGDNVVRLLEGRLVVFAEAGGVAGALQIDSAPGSVRIDGSGEVRVSLLNDGQRDGLEVSVVRGIATIMTDGSETPVQAGQDVVVYEGDWPSAPVAFNSARADAFYLWSQGLLDSRRGTTSAAYLPSELNVYASTFDQNGSWSYLAPYGYVWYPTVAATWRPYYYGNWRFYGGYGWTFIGHGGRWLYPTHHYGRWGLSPAQRWYWIPTLGWSPAWVHWAVAPGYVGWCPLGWNSRPVLGFWGHRGYYRGYNPGSAWTVVAAGSFGRGYIGGARFDPRVFRGSAAPSFVVQPMQPRIAVPRGLVVAPNARLAGNTAVPRGSFTPNNPYSGSAAASGPRSRQYVPPASSSTVYRPGIARPPAARTPTVTSPPAYSSRTYSNSGVATPSGGGVRTAGAGTPPVIYYRGTPVPPRAGSNPANAYERAGVAVPRSLPGSTGSPRQVMPAPPPQYRGPSAPYQGSGDPSPRSGGRMSSPGAAPRGGIPYAVPRSSGSYSRPGITAPPSSSPRSMAPMRPMGAPAGTWAPPGRMSAPPAGMSAPPARTAPPTSAPSQAVPRSGHSRR